MTRRPRRRTVLVLAALLALAVAAGALVLATTRGPGPDDVAEDYLTAQWRGEWRAQCDLATREWQHVLFAGHPFADCADYARTAEKANGDSGFLPYADDTDIDVTVETVNDDDGRSRVDYLLEFGYHGDDEDGFDALWQGGGPVDRGTVELAEVDGEWRVAGVDAG